MYTSIAFNLKYRFILPLAAKLLIITGKHDLFSKILFFKTASRSMAYIACVQFIVEYWVISDCYFLFVTVITWYGAVNI